jgi:hypothetical protein
MQNFPTLPKGLNTHRFHQPSAMSGAITRINIDMLTIQTTRTMIRVPTPNNNMLAMHTHKILSPFLEMFSFEGLLHVFSIAFPDTLTATDDLASFSFTVSEWR